MSETEEKIKNLMEITETANFLSESEKRKIKYYLTDEDYVNESHAIITLVEIILKELL